MNKITRNIIIGIGVLILFTFYFLFNGKKKDEQFITAIVKRTDLIVEVVSTGELKSKNSTVIYGPNELRNLGIRNIKITNIVAEGTIVNEGDYVASLDPSEVGGKLTELKRELEQKQAEYKSALLDTSLTHQQERDNITDLKEQIETTEIELKQSKYEPPAVQRQIEMRLEKAQRNYSRALIKFDLKKEQSIAKVAKVLSEVLSIKEEIAKINDVMNRLTILSPQKGMINYIKDWSGNKIKSGSSIGTWSTEIASLPDLSEMLSITYVNEIDISKINKGQTVVVTLDALPDKSLEGIIVEVANMGEQRPNTDAKVFEVQVKLLDTSSLIKPAMTTTNKILINEYSNELIIPIEGVFSNDSIQYVYKKEGIIFKQEIITGKSNESHIIVKHGLNEGDEISLIKPEKSEELEVQYIEESIKQMELDKKSSIKTQQQDSTASEKINIDDIFK